MLHGVSGWFVTPRDYPGNFLATYCYIIEQLNSFSLPLNGTGNLPIPENKWLSVSFPMSFSFYVVLMSVAYVNPFGSIVSSSSFASDRPDPRIV